MKFSAVLAALASVAAVSAETFNVIVGGNSTLTFNPTSVTAAVGDTISFEFHAKNHTVTQSTFANPCAQMTTPTLGIDSGYVPVAADATSFPVWSFTMTNASAPLWFYCKQTGHCAKGMVFAVNPTAEKSFTAFQSAAMATAANTSSTTPSASAAAGGSASGTAGAAAASGSAAASGAGRVAGGAAGALAAVGLAAGLLL